MADAVKRVPQLHEVLAVEGDLEKTAGKVIAEAITTFTKKPDHFLRFLKTLKMFDGDRKNQDTSEESVMVTTVGDKLRYTTRHIAKWFDVYAQKDATNQIAKADLIVDGTVLAMDLPATLLLSLETKLKQVRSVYDAIPTLQPGVAWEPDESQGKGVYRQQTPDRRLKTEKTVQHRVLYEATKEHPAQIEKWNADVPVGEIVQENWSGMISPAKKSELLGRLDTLIRAVKRARAKANTTEVVNKPVGKIIFDYIHQA